MEKNLHKNLYSKRNKKPTYPKINREIDSTIIESDLIKKSVEKSITEGFVTKDLSSFQKSFSTSEVGDKICDYIK